MYACICMHVYVCMYMYVCICVCICMHVCMYMCVCIHVYVCMHNIWGELSGELSYPKREGELSEGNCPRGEVSGGIVLHPDGWMDGWIDGRMDGRTNAKDADEGKERYRCIVERKAFIKLLMIR